MINNINKVIRNINTKNILKKKLTDRENRVFKILEFIENKKLRSYEERKYIFYGNSKKEILFRGYIDNIQNKVISISISKSYVFDKLKFLYSDDYKENLMKIEFREIVDYYFLKKYNIKSYMTDIDDFNFNYIT